MASMILTCTDCGHRSSLTPLCDHYCPPVDNPKGGEMTEPACSSCGEKLDEHGSCWWGDKCLPYLSEAERKKRRAGSPVDGMGVQR